MDELALEIFYILTERDIKTLGDQKDFCRHIAKWHLEKLAQLEAENDRLREPLVGHDTNLLLAHARRLKQSDGEGWAIGEMVERALKAGDGP